MKMAPVAAAGILALARLGGCVPGEPFAPVAVGMNGSAPEVRYTACKPAKVKSVKVISLKPGQLAIDGSEPVVWKVSFALPVSLRSVAIGGSVPAGGAVDVALAQPLDAATWYEAFLELDDGTNPHEGFQLDKLTDGHVSYQDRYITADEFDRLARCG